MSDIPFLPALSPSEARQVDQICDRFEAAWKERRPSPEEYLAAAGEPARSALLRQLLLVDWYYRRQAGDDPQAADYQARFPGDSALIEDVRREMSEDAVSTQVRADDANAQHTPWTGDGGPAYPGEADAGTETVPDRYALVREVGHGGIGVVFRCRDRHLGREVAVKVLHEDYRDQPDARRRFIAEARVGSQLQHPSIVPIYEQGWFKDRRPYLTMKLVEGHTLAALLRDRADPGQDLPRLLGVFAPVCQAMAYAHARGVVHRDLKPANIMVGAFGEVQVMDWGFAKVCGGDGTAAEADPAENDVAERAQSRPVRGPSTVSQSGVMMGTPAYMPPEQARGEAALIDARADVFALGAILGEILTGRPPYIGASAEDVCGKAAAGDLADAYARLDACGADVELHKLARRCLAAERANRPPDAGIVSQDLTAYLTSAQEQLRQAQLERAAAQARALEQRKRRRVQRALVATVLLALVGGVVATTWQALRATRAESDALSVADRNRRLLYAADVHLASQAWQSEAGTVSMCKELLLAHVPGPGQPDLREFAWRFQWRLLHPDSPVVRLPVVPRAAGVAAGHRVVTLDASGKVNAWLIGDWEPREQWAVAESGVLGVTLARNGEVAAVIDRNGSPKVLNVRTGPRQVQIRAPAALVDVKLSADGRFLAGVGRDQHARVWDTASGQQLYDYRLIDPSAGQIDLSLDGKQLLASGGGHGALLVLYRAGDEKPMVLHNKPGFNKLQGTLSPDGKLAAVPHAGNFIDLYDTTTGNVLRILPSRSRAVRVVFSPDGNHLAVGEKTGLITLWRMPQPLVPADQPAAATELAPTAAGERVARSLKGHLGAIEALAFTADGRKLISIGHDHTARCWDVGDQEESRVLQKDRRATDSLSYSPDGRYLVVASMGDGISVHDLTSTDPPRWLTTRRSRRAVFSPNGRTIAGGPDHRVTLWDAKTGGLLCTLTEAEPAETGAMAFSPDPEGRWLAVGVGGPHTFATDVPGKVMVFDVANRKVHRTFAAPTQVSAVAFSADGKVMAAAGHDGTIWLWDVSSWDEIARWQAPAGTRYASILFLAGGRQLAAGTLSGAIDVWDVRTRALARPILAHIDCVSVMALSADGRTLATASWDRSIKLWDSDTGRELRNLCREAEWVNALAFSPDGNTLASGGEFPVVRLWEASSRETVAADLAEVKLQADTSRPQ